MGNKVKYNLKNVHAAKLTRSEDGSFTYAKPKAIPGAVSISLDAEGDSSPFYADGIVYFRSTANNGYSGDLEIALIPEWFRTEILKEELDNNGVLIENATITELEKFALLFEFDGDVRSIRHVLYNCTSSRPSIESETKEDTIEPGKEKLTLTADPREDGLVKSRTGDATDAEIYKNWYQQVYVPVPKTEKTITIGDKQVKFRSSATIPRLYRAKFKRDIFKDLSRLESSYKGNSDDGSSFEIEDLEIFENVAYIMAYHADHSIPATIEEWLDEFEMFSIYEVLPEILELWGMNLQTEIESKKNFIAVAGK